MRYWIETMRHAQRSVVLEVDSLEVALLAARLQSDITLDDGRLGIVRIMDTERGFYARVDTTTISTNHLLWRNEHA